MYIPAADTSHIQPHLATLPEIKDIIELEQRRGMGRGVLIVFLDHRDRHVIVSPIGSAESLRTQKRTPASWCTALYVDTLPTAAHNQ
jgi:hypothetical protein